jgi:hypothetical protein
MNSELRPRRRRGEWGEVVRALAGAAILVAALVITVGAVRLAEDSPDFSAASSLDPTPSPSPTATAPTSTPSSGPQVVILATSTPEPTKVPRPTATPRPPCPDNPSVPVRCWKVAPTPTPRPPKPPPVIPTPSSCSTVDEGECIAWPRLAGS